MLLTEPEKTVWRRATEMTNHREENSRRYRKTTGWANWRWIMCVNAERRLVNLINNDSYRLPHEELLVHIGSVGAYHGNTAGHHWDHKTWMDPEFRSEFEGRLKSHWSKTNQTGLAVLLPEGIELVFCLHELHFYLKEGRKSPPPSPNMRFNIFNTSYPHFPSNDIQLGI